MINFGYSTLCFYLKTKLLTLFYITASMLHSVTLEICQAIVSTEHSKFDLHATINYS